MTWWALLGMSVITFFNRYAFLSSVVRYTPGAKVKRLLSYSSYAVLTAIWTPIIFQYSADGIVSHSGYDYLIATGIAALMATLRIPSIIIVLLSTGVFFWLRYVWL